MVNQTVVAAIAGLVLTATFADALTVNRADIKRGTLDIKGKDAIPGAIISVDGVGTIPAEANGRFRIAVDTLPSDCVATVSDGVNTVDAVVRNCGPQGEPGPAGPPGVPGALLVMDSAGTDLGVLAGKTRITSGTQYSIYLPATGGFVLLQQYFSPQLVSTGRGLTTAPQGTVSFANVDCLGEAFIDLTSSDAQTVLIVPYNAPSVAAPTRFYLVGAPTAEPQAIQSYLETTGECTTLGAPFDLQVAYEAIQIAAPFPTPLVMPLQVVPAE